MKSIKWGSKYLIAIKVLLIYLAFSIEYGVNSATNYVGSSFWGSFRGDSAISFVSCVFLSFFIYYTEYKYVTKNNRCVISLSVIISLLCLLGKSFEDRNEWTLLITSSWEQILKSIILFAAYYIVCYHLFSFLFCIMDTIKSSNASSKGLIGLLLRFPFGITFLTLIIIYIPYMVVSFPVTLQGDAISNVLPAYSDSGMWLNNLIPLTYTFLLKGFFSLGLILFGDANIAIFLYSLFQFLVVISAVSLSNYILIKKLEVNPWYGVFEIFFWGVCSLHKKLYVFRNKRCAICFFLSLCYSLFYSGTVRVKTEKANNNCGSNCCFVYLLT